MAGKAALRIFQKTWRSASSRATRTSLQPAFSHSAPTWSKRRLELGLRPVELDEQGRAGVERPARVGHRLRGADRQVVHHLDGPGHDARRDDVRHRVPGVPGRLEEGDERAHRLGRGHDADDDLRRHAQRALRADEDPAQVVAREVELLAAQLHDRAVGEHDLQAADVVGREAVLEAVRAAGVLGHVAADRAHDLRRRVGRIEVRGPDRGRDGDVRHAGLAHHALVVEVDLEDAPQPREDDEHAVLERAAPRPTGRCPSRAPPTARRPRGRRARRRPPPRPCRAARRPAGLPRTAAARRTRRCAARGAR